MNFNKEYILIYFILDLSAELTMSQRLAEFQIRLQFLESMYRARQEDVSILSQYISTQYIRSPNNDGTNITISGPLLDALSPETRLMLRNLSAAPRYPTSLRLPTAFHFLPHLLDDPSKIFIFSLKLYFGFFLKSKFKYMYIFTYRFIAARIFNVPWSSRSANGFGCTNGQTR